MPPPLDDDKSRNGDEFDLDDEEIEETNKSKEHSEVHTDFDVYNSAMKPPELSSALFFDTTPPPDDFDPSKISHDDSFEEDPEFHFNDDEKVMEINQLTVNTGESGYSTNSDEVIKSELCEKINLEKIEKFPSDNDFFKLEDLVETASSEESHENLFISPPQQSENEPKEIAISSFSTSLAFDHDDDDEGIDKSSNLHNEITVMDDINTNTLSDNSNYVEVIAFNDESLSDQEEEEEVKINQAEIDASDNAFDANFNNENEGTEATESVQELKLDDDDSEDDFNDFETAIPMHRHIETQNSVNIEQPQEEIHFEADFSAFEAFSETKDDDDDDFGDFNDFTQAPQQVTPASASNSHQESHSIDYVKSTDVKGLLNTMFVLEEGEMRVDMDKELDENYAQLQHNNVIKSDDIVKKLDDFDETLALGYLYNNSTASQILVKALGIDTRNIVSSMPF